MKIQTNLLMIIAFACTLSADAMIGKITQPVAKSQIFAINNTGNDLKTMFDEIIATFFNNRKYSSEQFYNSKQERSVWVNDSTNTEFIINIKCYVHDNSIVNQTIADHIEEIAEQVILNKSSTYYNFSCYFKCKDGTVYYIYSFMKDNGTIIYNIKENL